MSTKEPNQPTQNKQDKEGYYDWTKRKANENWENWKPWVEDQYLRWFTKDNKASYATKDTLDKSKVTGIDQIDTVQDGVNNLVAGQVGKGGLAQPVGDFASNEGINRAERKGKDDKGSYETSQIGKATEPLTSGAKNAGSTVMDGAKGAGGYMGSFLGKGEQSKK